MTRNSCLAWMGPNQLELLSKDPPAIADGEILLKVEACAICGSDLRIWKEGNARIEPGRIIGHEIAGTVTAVGKNVTKFQIGDRVATGADVPCGKCEFCTSGRANCCRTNYAIGYQFDGGFAQYMKVPELVVQLGPITKFTKNISFETASMAEPLACCLNGYEVALADRLHPKTLVIFGAGPIGLMLATLAPQYGIKKVIVIDPAEERLGFAKNLGLAHFTISSKNESLTEQVLKWTDGKGADLIFTACPDVNAHVQAVPLLAVRGVLNLFGGIPKNSDMLKLDSNFIHYREAYITGSHGSTPEHHRRALEMIEDGKIEVSNLISKKFPLSQFATAFKLADSKSALKVIISPHV